ncbi:MAG: xanthine dehydrogenase family protein molybdopterin-binding subunit [Ilumatobacter sp.]|nr:xanthine dehydrogenase family protein molybdopterin-binding subunit [Ilumatobacter sp.]
MGDRSATSAPGSVLGTRVQRTEDPALLTGVARYLADVEFDEPLHAVFVHSDVAHGLLGQVHVDDAASMPGVVAVWTAAELRVAPHHGFAAVHADFKRPPLATDRVRFVGESIAVVFAESEAAAADAAATVWAEIDTLDAITDMDAALAPTSPPIFPDHGDNQATMTVGSERCDPGTADVTVRGRFVNQRVAVVPLEPDRAAAAVDADGRLTLWASTQMPHALRGQLARALSLDAADVRVVTPAVGGGFGGKAGVQPEHTVIAAAAQRLGRPVVWVPPRSNDMIARPHSRGQIQFVELGCTTDGRFTDLRVRILNDAGAYPNVGAMLPGLTRNMATGPYLIPALEFDIAVAVTNTTPMGAYRGAGRPEATALLERIVDMAARELDIDPIEIRRRNLLADDAFPFQTIAGPRYDTGSYRLPLDTAASIVGYEELRAEQDRRRDADDHRLLGIGVASYVEVTAGGTGTEFGAVEVHDDGTATVYAGTLSHGQGHQTAFAMLVTAQTGIAVDMVTLVDGDTDRIRSGGGTGGSRSLQLGGSAVHGATEVLVDAAKQVAARVLEADTADIVIDTAAGTIGVAGVPAQALSWAELAGHAAAAGEPLRGELDFEQSGGTFPFGAHIAVVEVDADTGQVTLLRHVAVDDCGTVLNPLIVEGQQHGGIAAGVGQALYEEVRFDVDGNPVTSNLADYGIVSAAELPSFDVSSTETPTPLNPLGAKGIGEAATIGATPAVQNAVIDAVAHLGVRHIDLPCTPERVWSAIVAARAATLPDPWTEPPDVFDRNRAEAAGETTSSEPDISI